MQTKEQTKIKKETYMIWQVTVMSALQRPIAIPLAIPATLVRVGEAVTPTATPALEIATTARLTAATSSIRSDHFYMCSTECCENQNVNI